MIRSWQGTVEVEDDGLRVDSYVVSQCSDFIRSLASDESTLFFIDNKEVKKSRKVRVGQLVKVEWTEQIIDTNLEAQDIPLKILFEDNDLLVIDKQQSLVVHPGAGNLDNTLVNALIHRYGKDFFTIDEESNRPGIVHRLDKETSGIMVIALNEKAHKNIALQFKNRSVTKTYIAIVEGKISHDMMRIEKPIIRDPSDRRRFTVSKLGVGKSAITEYKLLRKFNSHALLRVSIETGRTHQIRVHLKSVGLPIVGDQIYGKKSELPMMLHALSLTFKHPQSSEELTFRAQMPKRFRDYIKEYLDD